MKVTFVASEALPYVKTGGLGDVTGSLPSALRSLGAETTLILPFYAAIKARDLPVEQVMTSSLTMDGRTLPFTVLRHQQTLFIQQDEFFQRDGLYNTREGDYPDNWLRFAFFSRAALETIIALGGADVIHVHDWQTALLPLYLRVLHPDRHERTLLTIHNIAYQGLSSPEILPDIGLPESVFTQEGLEFYGKVNYLKAGIVWADRVNTVSPSYAREILTDAYGFGLQGMLAMRRNRLSGILNGIDYDYWDPSTDTALRYVYGVASLSERAQNKLALIQEVGLDQEPGRALFVMVSRLVAQKGVDLLLGAFDEMMSLPISLIILGTGDAELETALVAKTASYRGRFVLIRKFDEGLAHRMYAGSDFFLMPSRFEPCGLSQMIALRYGSIPVVRRTGGLKDTIQSVHSKTRVGNGISFDDATPSEFLEAVRQAESLYADRDLLLRIQTMGMNCDFSWQSSAHDYLELYTSMEVSP
ncbi:MAG: glycogen synthase GlgA [Candidatus Cryosericum sp.]